MKKILYQTDSFCELREENGYYVDKSELVSALLSEKLMMFSRPRRFGKTLNMSMLYYFFSLHEKKHAHIFDGLKVMEDPEALNHMNRYPVIFLTLKNMEKFTFAGQMEQFGIMMYQLVDQFSELFSSDSLNDQDKEMLNRFHERKAVQTELENSLYLLSALLEKHYNEKVIILIDEYDVPLQAAYSHDYYDQMAGFLRSLFGTALKSNNSLKKGVLTGCLRIAKESIFTGLNNFSVNSIMNDGVFSRQFGFTQGETDELLAYYDMSDCTAAVREWYDGYQFGTTEIYNPWSVINYVSHYVKDGDRMPQMYWVNTSGNQIVEDYLKKGSGSFRNDFEVLFSGGCVEKKISQELTYREMDDPRNIYSYLLFTGYLKPVSQSGYDSWKLMIPNKEIHYIYEHAFRVCFEEYRDMKSSQLYESLENGNSREAEAIINDILFHSISYYDNQESFYHGFLMGILHGLNVESNREAGEGRFDICIIPSGSHNTGIVIECKHSKSASDLQKGSRSAAEQIVERHYLQDAKFSACRHTKGYGMAFHKKRCFVTGVDEL